MLPPIINNEFPSSYMVEVISEMPPNGEIYYNPKLDQSLGRDGFLVKVTPYEVDDAPWTGMFRPGCPENGGFSGVFSCPNPKELCVVSSGSGYIGKAKFPSEFIGLEINPITDVRPILKIALILFSNFTTIFAWGIKGLAWKSKRISSDGVKLGDNDEKFIWGHGWDAISSHSVEFCIDLKTGQLV